MLEGCNNSAEVEYIALVEVQRVAGCSLAELGEDYKEVEAGCKLLLAEAGCKLLLAEAGCKLLLTEAGCKVLAECWLALSSTG